MIIDFIAKTYQAILKPSFERFNRKTSNTLINNLLCRFISVNTIKYAIDQT